MEAHLADHLERLPGRDGATRAILEQMARDEVAHGKAAEGAGGAEVPWPVRRGMALGGEILRRVASRGLLHEDMVHPRQPGLDLLVALRQFREAARAVADTVEPEPPQQEERRLDLRWRSGVPRVAIAYHAPEIGHPDSYPLQVLAVALAEGMLYADDPSFYQSRLQQLARVTPDQVRAAMQRWLTRPVYALRVDPGEREAYEEAPGVTGARAGGVEAASQRPRYYREPEAGEATMAPLPFVQREMPPIGETPELDFPEVQRSVYHYGLPDITSLSSMEPAVGSSPVPSPEGC